jgi:hypothetical protein
MKIFGRLKISALLFFFLSSIIVNAQVKKGSTQSYSSKSQTLSVDQESGYVLINEFIGDRTKRVLKDGNTSGSISEDEQIVHVTSTSFYTQNKKNTDGFILRRYNLRSFIEESFLLYKKQTFLIFFDSGAFIIVDAGESEGYEIAFYSENLELIKKFTPFTGGFENVQYSVYKNTVALGFKALSADEGNRLISFNSTADLQFNEQIPAKAAINTVVTSKNLTAVHWYNPEKKENELLCFDPQGTLRWTTRYKTPIDKLVIYNGGFVFTSGTGNLYLLNSLNGNVVEKKKLTEIYDKFNITRSRQDNYVKLIDIQPFNNDESISILLTEPTRSQRYANIVLFTFNGKIEDKYSQTFSIGESSVVPTLKKSKKELLIIKDKEILKYEFQN